MPNGDARPHAGPRAGLRAAAVALDGVLADLAPARAAAYAEALAAEGLPAPADAVARAARDAGDVGDAEALEQVLAAAHGSPHGAADEAPWTALGLAQHRADRLLADRLRHGGVVLAPGAADAVHALAARLRLALVTGLGRETARLVLDVAGFTPLFAVVVAGDGPAPAGRSPWAVALDRLAARDPRLSADHTAALCGTGPSAAAARRAGLQTVRVGPLAPDGLHPGDPTAAAPHGPVPPAHAVVPTLAGLTPAALARALDLAPLVAS